MADYFFKDHHFGRCVGSAMFISPFQAQLIHCASRRAEAPGYARRSPPVRAMADYFFKDHHFGRCVGSAMFISPFQAQLIHCPNSFFRKDFW
jgi:hypothetical protein